MAANSHTSDDGLISGINVTPLVDVTLVLLIIFMVTAKIVVSHGMPMDLPQAATGNVVQTVFSVELFEDGRTLVDGQAMRSDQELFTQAKNSRTAQTELRAVVRADSRVPHGRVIAVLDGLNAVGIAKVAFGVNPKPIVQGEAHLGAP